MGLRKPANNVLNENEIQQLKDDIHLIGAEESIISFNSEYVRGTCYRPQEDRYYLILDALERAREAFISIKYNDFIRRALHGTNQLE